MWHAQIQTHEDLTTIFQCCEAYRHCWSHNWQSFLSQGSSPFITFDFLPSSKVMSLPRQSQILRKWTSTCWRRTGFQLPPSCQNVSLHPDSHQPGSGIYTTRFGITVHKSLKTLLVLCHLHQNHPQQPPVAPSLLYRHPYTRQQHQS